jgi:pyruvate/2-oxoglutarate dehydrogenase complex dihydrolipoamide acyltransferase (E2) component
MNAIWTDAGIRRFDGINIGLAVNADRGLMNPVIRDLKDDRSTEIIQKTGDATESTARKFARR